MQSEAVSREEFCDAATIQRLVELLGAPRRAVAQSAASVLAQTCGASEQRQTAAAEAGAVSNSSPFHYVRHGYSTRLLNEHCTTLHHTSNAGWLSLRALPAGPANWERAHHYTQSCLQVPALMGMVRSGERGQQEAAVAALAALSDSNALVSAAVAALDGAVPALQGLLRDRDPGIRLLAAACLVQLLRFEHVPSSNQVCLVASARTACVALVNAEETGPGGWGPAVGTVRGTPSDPTGLTRPVQAVPRAVLTALVRSLQEPAVPAEEEAMQREAALLVPRLLAVLLTARPELQPLAADTDAVTRLCQQYPAQPAAQSSHKVALPSGAVESFDAAVNAVQCPRPSVSDKHMGVAT